MTTNQCISTFTLGRLRDGKRVCFIRKAKRLDRIMVSDRQSIIEVKREWFTPDKSVPAEKGATSD